MDGWKSKERLGESTQWDAIRYGREGAGIRYFLYNTNILTSKVIFHGILIIIINYAVTADFKADNIMKLLLISEIVVFLQLDFCKKIIKFYGRTDKAQKGRTSIFNII